jgi:3'-phosphoadenosine 5'-phosphosulfate sulfotransferase (PAPS reductase)/FAD synthetase
MDKYTLKLRQAMPLADKIRFTQRRLNEWVEHFGIDGVYISFSGGKDSTVLLDIARKLYPDIKAMYVDTGLEYPEIKQFVKTFDNVDIIRPKMMFNKVIEKYGYPIISKEQSQYLYEARTTKSDKLRDIRINGSSFSISKKWLYLLKAPFKISHKCCSIMKKNPAHKYQKDTNRKPIIATMADESILRTQQYLKHGCNAFNNKIPTSTPMAFWTEQDVLEYLYTNKVNYCSVYGDIINEYGKFYTTGCKRTGCMFCGYGCHLEKEPNRFQMLAKTHPKQYTYIINTLGFGKVLDYINVKY